MFTFMNQIKDISVQVRENKIMAKGHESLLILTLTLQSVRMRTKGIRPKCIRELGKETKRLLERKIQFDKL